jgi:hypothetical protein
MSFWKKLIGRNEVQVTVNEPNIRFGRFSDSYKEERKYDAWDKAIIKFEKGDYLDSFGLFLEYLNDDEQGNVEYDTTNERIDFKLYQGSKLIVGHATGEKMRAEAKIANASKLNIGFLRRLLEQNFNLKYSRYALDAEDNITMVFTTYMLNGSPYKLYYALKELAISADKQDDLLIGEFQDVLKPVNIGHIRVAGTDEVKHKFNFLISRLNKTIKEVDEGKLNVMKYPGGIAYLLLDSVYRLDYLIKPEGFTMETFENIHRMYFSQDGKSAHEKNQNIRKELIKLLSLTEDKFERELYGVKSTFGITAPSSQDQLSSYIDGELKNMKWYQDNNYDAVALAIPGYIVGYSLFNYALPAPDKELLHLYFKIFEGQFFQDLGFDAAFIENGAIIRKKVINGIETIARRHKKTYPKFNPNTKQLNFDNNIEFARSYLSMVRDIDLTKSKRK